MSNRADHTNDRDRQRQKTPARPAPQRTCIVCRQVKPKRELVRVVRTPAGKVEVDPGGKKSGRGAYLCRTSRCWEAGVKRRKLEHALKVVLDPEQLDSLVQFSKTLANNETSASGRVQEIVDEAKGRRK